MIKKVIHKVRRTLTLMSHAGSNYECPFCNYKAKDLVPLGLDLPVLREKHVVGAGRRNAGCYQCGSTDRERLIYIYLKDSLRIFEHPEWHILHLAPEKNLSKALIQGGIKNYVCGDLFTEGYHYPDYVQNMDVQQIPYSDKHFDLIICNHLLEHVPDDKKAMNELNRVLKDNGTAILQVPISMNSERTSEDFSVTDPKEREQKFGQFDHVRIYGQDYVTRLQSCGLQVTKVNISSNYPKLGLNPEEDIYTVKKV